MKKRLAKASAKIHLFFALSKHIMTYNGILA